MNRITLWHIGHRDEFFGIDENGQISGGPNNVKGSDHWRCVGAVTRNNFGRVTRVWSLAEVCTNQVPWMHKNGKQKSFLLDFDHGTYREWTGRHRISPHHF